MFHTPPETLKARKPHRCTSCGEMIAPGESYARWASFDDAAFTNKMHPECLEAHEEEARAHGDGSGGWEYSPCGTPRPAKAPAGPQAPTPLPHPR